MSKNPVIQLCPPPTGAAAAAAAPAAVLPLAQAFLQISVIPKALEAEPVTPTTSTVSRRLVPVAVEI